MPTTSSDTDQPETSIPRIIIQGKQKTKSDDSWRNSTTPIEESNETFVIEMKSQEENCSKEFMLNYSLVDNFEQVEQKEQQESFQDNTKVQPIIQEQKLTQIQISNQSEQPIIKPCIETVKWSWYGAEGKGKAPRPDVNYMGIIITNPGTIKFKQTIWPGYAVIFPDKSQNGNKITPEDYAIQSLFEDQFLTADILREQNQAIIKGFKIKRQTFKAKIHVDNDKFLTEAEAKLVLGAFCDSQRQDWPQPMYIIKSQMAKDAIQRFENKIKIDKNISKLTCDGIYATERCILCTALNYKKDQPVQECEVCGNTNFFYYQ